MSVSEKIEIVHKMLVNHEHLKEVAREHRIGPGVVFSLVNKARKNLSFIDELMSRREEIK